MASVTVSVTGLLCPTGAAPSITVTVIEPPDSTSAEIRNSGLFIKDVALDEGSRLQHIRVVQEGGNAYHMASTRARLSRNAFYKSHCMNLEE